VEAVYDREDSYTASMFCHVKMAVILGESQNTKCELRNSYNESQFLPLKIPGGKFRENFLKKQPRGSLRIDFGIRGGNQVAVRA
jgi:hypothetical protein